MYEIAYLGRWETLPETAAAICDHDTPKLEALLQGGLDLDVPIQLSEYIKPVSYTHLTLPTTPYV